jgi:hypothetical protein
MYTSLQENLHKRWGIWPAEWLTTQKGFCSMELQVI